MSILIILCGAEVHPYLRLVPMLTSGHDDDQEDDDLLLPVPTLLGHSSPAKSRWLLVAPVPFTTPCRRAQVTQDMVLEERRVCLG